MNVKKIIYYYIYIYVYVCYILCVFSPATTISTADLQDFVKSFSHLSQSQNNN